MSQHKPATPGHQLPTQGGSYLVQPDGSLKPNTLPKEAAHETPADDKHGKSHAAKKGR